LPCPAAQAVCPRLPYLPRVGDAETLSSPEAALLDRQFRLLREDLMASLRQVFVYLGVQTPLSGAELQDAARPKRAYNAQIERQVYQLVATLGVESKPRPCLMVAIQLPMSHRAARMSDYKERKEHWESHGKGTLPLDALAVLVPPKGSNQPLVFATVARRNPKEMAEATPMLGLVFDRGQNVEHVMQLLGRGQLQGYSLVQVRKADCTPKCFEGTHTLS
jgi:hypothetical protein